MLARDDKRWSDGPGPSSADKYPDANKKVETSKAKNSDHITLEQLLKETAIRHLLFALNALLHLRLLDKKNIAAACRSILGQDKVIK
ncbi:uncharacterized protein N0V89_012525 [Didymosphaeria variabile]|uniref:Uncharacterized protein n=1 Tax=Didymosphaeria variabile TaxID=1932322 RepID=A0A9W8X9R9_9PLEO|nr:uncharacterized protein N0V89_012525 [Didymosphaeria variabile]KAJ4344781.1 hypothetical protein N0V89_012525 [Didymosphaeria variabile]